MVAVGSVRARWTGRWQGIKDLGMRGPVAVGLRLRMAMVEAVDSRRWELRNDVRRGQVRGLREMERLVLLMRMLMLMLMRLLLLLLLLLLDMKRRQGNLIMRLETGRLRSWWRGCRSIPGHGGGWCTSLTGQDATTSHPLRDAVGASHAHTQRRQRKTGVRARRGSGGADGGRGGRKRIGG